MSAQFPEAHALPGTSSTGQAGERPLNRLLERLTEVAQGQRGRFALHVQRGTLGLTLLAVILGVYLAAQWQSRPRPAAGAPEYRREIAAQTIQRLEIEQADLKRQIAEMRAELANRQRDAAAGQSDLTHLSADLAEEKLAAGTVPVRGPGVRILLDDSAVKTIPPKEDPAMYIVHEYQLRDVVNLLWSAGAEAISINGERMVAPSSIYCVGSTILVNDTRTSPPYEFLVIGDASKLEAVVGDASNLRALKSRIRLYGLQFATQKTKDIVVPAYDGSLDVRHVLLTEPLSTRGGGR